MLTHELADALRKLSTVLKRGPNVTIDDIGPLFNLAQPDLLSHKKSSSQDLPIALSALLSLSRVDKMDWINLIRDLRLNIQIRPRDASRDILGKVLRVLEAEPAARERLQRKVQNREVQASPELARALSSLLDK